MTEKTTIMSPELPLARGEFYSAATKMFRFISDLDQRLSQETVALDLRTSMMLRVLHAAMTGKIVLGAMTDEEATTFLERTTDEVVADFRAQAEADVAAKAEEQKRKQAGEQPLIELVG